jgi:triacylglycerol esterase/lipase EstA (alpha/beta hydrolase family)
MALGFTLALGLVGAGSAAADALPVPFNEITGIAAGVATPEAAPPGANDWSCVTSAAHPYPVILVPGTFANMRASFDSLSPLLHDHGYCVFSFNYGTLPGTILNGYEAMEGSAATLSSFVQRVLTATDAKQVDLVGHSQGGVMPRYYLKYLGGAPYVHTMVGLAPANHGTTLDGIDSVVAYLGTLGYGSGQLLPGCDACGELQEGSSWLNALNSPSETMPGVTYVNIASTTDEGVTPYTTSWLSGSDVTNETVQSGCPIDFSGHVELLFSPRSLAMVLNALDPQHRGFVPCLAVPFTG